MLSLSENIFGSLVTAAHLFLCVTITYGSLFSKTPFQAYVVLCCLVTMFLMIRKFNCCIMSPLENSDYIPKTTEMGRSFLVQNLDTKISHTEFEEITVGNAILTHIIKMCLLLTVPSNMLF